MLTRRWGPPWFRSRNHDLPRGSTLSGRHHSHLTARSGPPPGVYAPVRFRDRRTVVGLDPPPRTPTVAPSQHKFPRPRHARQHRTCGHPPLPKLRFLKHRPAGPSEGPADSSTPTTTARRSMPSRPLARPGAAAAGPRPHRSATVCAARASTLFTRSVWSLIQVA